MDSIDAGTLLLAHPVCVHFAVALTVVAVLLDAAGARSGNESWQRAAGLNLALGVAGLSLAVASGWFESRLPQAEQPFTAQAERLLQYHEYLGFGLLGLFACLLVWRLRAGGKPTPFLLTLAFLGLVGLTVQGYLGGEIVYRYGFRVKAVELLATAASAEP